MNDANGRIAIRKIGPIFDITIDRPEKYNGFTPRMFRELSDAYNAYEDGSDLRCAVISANGNHFTAGLDLPKMAAHLNDDFIMATEGKIDIFGLRPPYRTKPVICAVKGICFTLGIELMLASDIVVAAENSRFAQIEVQRGIIPGGGATGRMVARAGWGNAMKYLLTGEEFDAQTAKSLNFVQEIVPVGEEKTRALQLAEMICESAPLAVQHTLINARSVKLHGEEAGYQELGKIQRSLLQTSDFQEGLKSFKEKRRPKFSGK